MITIGIDPGISGALCLMEDGRILAIADVPSVKRVVNKDGRQRSEVDAYELAAIIDRWVKISGLIHRAAIEHVQAIGLTPAANGRPARKGDGVVGAFSFGDTAGCLRMALASHFIPATRVPPATWRKDLGIQRVSKGDKSAVVSKATEMWPDHADRWAAKCHADRAEAALIAFWSQNFGW